MADEVSNKTIAILVAVVLVISVVGTWTVLSNSSDDTIYVQLPNVQKQDSDVGRVALYNNAPADAEKGRVSLSKLN
jgi:hypothetical protein